LARRSRRGRTLTRILLSGRSMSRRMSRESSMRSKATRIRSPVRARAPRNGAKRYVVRPTGEGGFSSARPPCVMVRSSCGLPRLERACFHVVAGSARMLAHTYLYLRPPPVKRYGDHTAWIYLCRAAVRWRNSASMNAWISPSRTACVLDVVTPVRASLTRCSG